MKLYDAIENRRTIRKFRQKKIDREIIGKLIHCARIAPSGANLQPLKYIVVDDPERVESVFSTLKWAGYIAPEGNPKEGQRPVAYIIVVVDTKIRKLGAERDVGAAVQNILLAAHAEGLGSCWIGSVDRKRLAQDLDIDPRYIIDSVIALGYPAEKSIYEDEQGSIEYYKDSNHVMHVPKRKLEDILIFDEEE
ncbi:MAG: nitroreductase family protein [Clostridia bacterium]|nr:nitroreductase family protein [Clostridia bacterium]